MCSGTSSEGRATIPSGNRGKSRTSATGSSVSRGTYTLRRPPRKLPRIATFTLEPRGPFTLASAARFIAGWPPAQAEVGDDTVRLRFLVDDWSGPATVVLEQPDGVVHGTVEADNEERAIAQAARIVSLDHDGRGYAEVGERDP